MDNSTITTFEQLHSALRAPVAHRVLGEVFPFSFATPDLYRVIDEARKNPKTRIAAGTRGDRLLQNLAEVGGDFRAPIHLSLFELGSLRAPGGALADVVDEVYLPLTRLWAERDVCWQKAYPILFLSGPGCSTNYHWDPSSVLIVQLCGRKRYHSLKEPRRWCSEETADQGHEAMVRPIGLREDDIFLLRTGAGRRGVEPVPSTALGGRL